MMVPGRATFARLAACVFTVFLAIASATPALAQTNRTLDAGASRRTDTTNTTHAKMVYRSAQIPDDQRYLQRIFQVAAFYGLIRVPRAATIPNPPRPPAPRDEAPSSLPALVAGLALGVLMISGTFYLVGPFDPFAGWRFWRVVPDQARDDDPELAPIAIVTAGTTAPARALPESQLHHSDGGGRAAEAGGERSIKDTKTAAAASVLPVSNDPSNVETSERHKREPSADQVALGNAASKVQQPEAPPAPAYPSKPLPTRARFDAAKAADAASAVTRLVKLDGPRSRKLADMLYHHDDGHEAAKQFFRDLADFSRDEIVIARWQLAEAELRRFLQIAYPDRVVELIAPYRGGAVEIDKVIDRSRNVGSSRSVVVKLLVPGFRVDDFTQKAVIESE